MHNLHWLNCDRQWWSWVLSPGLAATYSTNASQETNLSNGFSFSNGFQPLSSGHLVISTSGAIIWIKTTLPIISIIIFMSILLYKYRHFRFIFESLRQIYTIKGDRTVGMNRKTASFIIPCRIKPRKRISCIENFGPASDFSHIFFWKDIYFIKNGIDVWMFGSIYIRCDLVRCPVLCTAFLMLNDWSANQSACWSRSSTSQTKSDGFQNSSPFHLFIFFACISSTFIAFRQLVDPVLGGKQTASEYGGSTANILDKFLYGIEHSLKGFCNCGSLRL